MFKVCPTCGKSYPGEQARCPVDGVDLIEQGQQPMGYDVTPQPSPELDTTGVPVPAPPPREPSAPSAPLSVSGSQLGVTPAPSGRGIGSQPVANGGVNTAPAASTQDIQISRGDMVNEYQISGQLGEGGMGTVYEGVQPVIGKRVAIKVLLREFASNAEVVSRFIQEARVVNQARSRYIVDIFSFGELCDGRHYFVMEYLDGKSLREELDQQGVLPFDEAFAILSCMAKGLAAAHKVGIIHRDIKPENIVVLREGDGVLSAKVLDFGIAKLQGSQADPSFVTKTGAAMGTPYYMSPEQCRGQDVDHRTDVYALGIITYEMFTGGLPYSANSYIELVNKHLFSTPPNPSEQNPQISTPLEDFILRCIAKDPKERPQTMEQFREELAQLVPSLRKTHTSEMVLPEALSSPNLTGGEEAAQRTTRGAGRGLVLGLVGLLVLAGLGVGVYLWSAGRSPVEQGGVTIAAGSESTIRADSGGRPAAEVALGQLALSSTPAGAEVWIDGVKQRGITPLRLELKPGQRRLRLTKGGFKELELALNIEAGVKQAQAVILEAVAESKSDTASISAQVDRKATFFLDGTKRYVGSLFKLDGLKPGKYELKIKASRHRDRIEIIELKPGEAFSQEYKLRRKGKPRRQTGRRKQKDDDKDDTLNPFRKQ